MDLVVETLPMRPAPAFEIVERKGLGHPDTICDALADAVGRALCRAYLDRAGRVLHYNVDKVLLVGGTTAPAFGGGEVRRPIEVVVAGRVTREFAGAQIPVEQIAEDACRRWLRVHLPTLSDADVRISFRLRPGSAELAGLFGRGGARANDTSAGVGFAPLSRVERAVLAVEGALTGPGAREARPWAGPDVKVMAIRRGEHVRLVVACAFVGRHLRDLADYLARRDDLREVVRRTASGVLGRDPDVLVNTADDPDAGSVYLTVTGTSAEAGDDGEVGRGNRANGLITPMRPMSMEAMAGKNVVSHVGRLYNTLANEAAADLVSTIPGVAEAECVLVGEIGRPVGDPALVGIRLHVAGDVDEQLVREVVVARIARVGEAGARFLAEEP